MPTSQGPTVSISDFDPRGGGIATQVPVEAQTPLSKVPLKVVAVAPMAGFTKPQ
jgi:hypothetical protein